MRLEHYPQEKLKNDLLAIIGKYLDIKKYRVFFFGSRVSGKGNDRSDIDVGIEGPERVPPEILLTIQEIVEKLPILYKIEIVDFTQVSKKFKDVAKQNIEMFVS